MADDAPGFEEALRYPLFSALFNRRSRRISKGVKEIKAGSLTYYDQLYTHGYSQSQADHDRLWHGAGA